MNKYSAKNEEEKKIIALLNTYCDARNSADLAKLHSTFHDDGIYISGRGGQFTKDKILETNPQDWLDNKVVLYNPDFKVNGNEAKVTMTAKYGSFKTTQIYTLVNESDNWLIMKVE
jgi:hypothetical protein